MSDTGNLQNAVIYDGDNVAPVALPSARLHMQRLEVELSYSEQGGKSCLAQYK